MPEAQARKPHGSAGATREPLRRPNHRRHQPLCFWPELRLPPTRRRSNQRYPARRDSFAVGLHVNRFFPVFRSLMMRISPQVLKTLLPQYAQMLGRIDTIHENARVSLERGASKNTDHDTIFEALTDATVPAEERTMPRLIDESWVILAAGTTTTARTLSIASFHIFSQGRILRRLREELRPVMPRLDSKPTFAELEGLPYLVSCSMFSAVILFRLFV